MFADFIKIILQMNVVVISYHAQANINFVLDLYPAAFCSFKRVFDLKFYHHNSHAVSGDFSSYEYKHALD